MRTIVLSDHAADQLAKIQEAKEERLRFENLVFRLKYKWLFSVLEMLPAKERKLRAEHNYLFWFACWLARNLIEMWEVVFSPKLPTEKTQNEEIWGAGRAGEKRLKAMFARLYNDDCVHIAGYMNQKGEIDQIVIGPNGVVCIEVKYMAGKVSCNGDLWWRDKCDRRGNVVQSQIPIADKGGRGPSRQVNEAADQLHAFISMHVPIERIHRAVVFTHKQSVFGRLSNATVDIVSRFPLDAAILVRSVIFNKKRPKLPVDKIAALICKEHAYHAERRAQRRRPRMGRISRPSRTES